MPPPPELDEDWAHGPIRLAIMTVVPRGSAIAITVFSTLKGWRRADPLTAIALARPTVNEIDELTRGEIHAPA